MSETAQNQLIVDEIEYDRVYLWTGQVAHLLNPKQPQLPNRPISRQASVCGTAPLWPGIWFGYTEEEAKIAAERPTCQICEKMVEAQRVV
jgi:hypothetical protein